MLKHGRLKAVAFDKEDEAYPPTEHRGPSRLALIRRGLFLLYLFSAAIFTAFFAYLSTSFRSPYWYRMITCAISRSGAAFIKWGQWASTRPDIFPVRGNMRHHLSYMHRASHKLVPVPLPSPLLYAHVYCTPPTTTHRRIYVIH